MWFHSVDLFNGMRKKPSNDSVEPQTRSGFCLADKKNRRPALALVHHRSAVGVVHRVAVAVAVVAAVVPSSFSVFFFIFFFGLASLVLR